MSNFLFIDEKTEWLANLDVTITASNSISNAKHDITAFVEEINNRLTDKPEVVVFINIERPYSKIDTNYYLQNCIGIELFKQLRIKGKTNHVILYGFLPLHWILKQNKANAIINTKGCTYLQLPFAANMLKPELYSEKADPEDFKSVLRRGAYNIDAFRHKEANYWGIKRCMHHFNEIIKLHNTIEDLNSIGDSINTDIYINKFGKEVLNRLIEADFVFSDDNEFKSIYNKSLVECEKKVKSIQLQKNNTVVFYFDDQAEDGWAELLSKSIFGTFDPDVTSDENFNISANNHFYYYKKLVKGIKTNEIISNINDATLNYIGSKLPDLFILDLRLTEEDQNPQKLPHELSGMCLLKKLSKVFAGVPKLIISASNKNSTTQMTFNEGAMSYWMKEGADVNLNLVNSLENYQELIGKIEYLLNLDHRCFNSLHLLINKVTKDNSWFIKEERWQKEESLFSISNFLKNKNENKQLLHRDKAKIKCIEKISENAKNKKDDVLLLLNQASYLFNNYLMSENNYNLQKARPVYCTIMNLLGQTIELIHDFDILVENDLRDFQDFKIFLYRGDYSGKIVYDFRNFGSHFELAPNVNEYVFYTFIKYLSYYLKTRYFKNINPILNEGDMFIKTAGYCGVIDESHRNAKEQKMLKKSALKVLANWPNNQNNGTLNYIEYNNKSNENISIVKINEYDRNYNTFIISDYTGDNYQIEYLFMFNELNKKLTDSLSNS